MRERAARYLTGPLFIAGLLLALEWTVQAGLIKRSLLPPPSVVWDALVQLIVSGDFAPPLMETLTRLAKGFAIGGLLAIAVGLLMGSFRAIHDLLEPLVEFIRPVPKSALIPALILFLGLGEAMKVTSVALAVFFPVLVNTVQGVRGVDPVLIDTARSFGVSRGRVLMRVVLPAALPYIMTGLRVSLGLGLVLATLSEMLAGTGGIGFVILDTQRSFRVRQMYAWIVILALVGLALNAVFVALERKLLHWQHGIAQGT